MMLKTYTKHLNAKSQYEDIKDMESEIDDLEKATCTGKT